MKILLSEAGSIHNKGDAAIFFTIYKSLKEKFPDAEFTAVADEPEQSKKLYGIRAGYAPYALPYKGKRWIDTLWKAIRFFFWAIFYHINKRFANLFLKKAERESIKYYEDADIVISAGGNALTDDYIGTLYFFLEIWWITMVILRKPLIVYAYSVGPFKYRTYKMLARHVLNKVDMFTLREDFSKDVLKDLKVTKPRIVVAADSAFLFWNANETRAKEILRKEGISKLKRPLLGISVREWNFRGHSDPSGKYTNYKIAVAAAADHAIEKLGANVVFLSTCFRGGKDNYTDDSLAADDIIKLMKHGEKAYVFRTEYNPDEIKAVIGQMDMFIGTRAHSTIFATTMGVPTIGLAYEFKTHGFLKLMGIEKYAHYMKDVDKNKLVDALDDLWKNRIEIRKTLKKNLPIVRQRANISAIATKKYIEDNYENTRAK